MPETPDVRIQLAAYLAGELDDAAVVALEARMQSEPWVADAADEMADMLVELGAVEEVDPPTGFADRLRAGLADEIGHELPQASRLDPDVVRASGAAALDGWSTTARGRRDRPAGTRPGDRHRQQTRRARFGRAAMAVAAGLVVLFVGTAAVFVSSSCDGRAATAVTFRRRPCRRAEVSRKFLKIANLSSLGGVACQTRSQRRTTPVRRLSSL